MYKTLVAQGFMLIFVLVANVFKLIFEAENHLAASTFKPQGRLFQFEGAGNSFLRSDNAICSLPISNWRFHKANRWYACKKTASAMGVIAFSNCAGVCADGVIAFAHRVTAFAYR